MAGIQRFEDLKCWKTARQLIYGLTDGSKFAKDYGLKDQIRRASVSIMSNIAEGFESRTDTQFVNYLGHSKGSSGKRARSSMLLWT